ncbi:MAG TPA: XdhC family protein [Streptosporangiaceae bacterium]|jgi:xanthine/CO dehydrogenase XdhC/CoxF family maturation factor
MANSHSDHEHDASCAVAHGTAPTGDAIAHGTAKAPAEQRTLAAVFASPVASFLLRYAADTGYRAVLVEPDPERAKAGAAQADETGPADLEIVATLDGVADGHTDVVVTDHHRDELGIQLRDALALGARWVGIMGNPRVAGPHIAALTELGVQQSEIAKVHRPIGLNIGSRRPAEIAIATIAGLIADRNGKPGGLSF